MAVKEMPLVFLVISFLQLSCGASKQSGKRADEDECNARATRILERETLCNPGEISAYKTELKKWQGECAHNAQPLTRNLIDQRLANSRTCALDTNVFDTKRQSCRHRIDVALGKKGCEKDQCDALLVEINEIVTDCAGLGKDGAGLSDARELLAELRSKTAEADSRKEFESLAQHCEKAKQLAAENNTDEAVKVLVLALAGSEVQKQIQDQDNAEASRDETLTRCKEALKETIDKHVATISALLQQGPRQSSSEKWLSSYRNLEGTNIRLQEVSVESILPGALKEMQQVLLKYDKQRNINESKSIDKNSAETKKVLAAGVEKCKSLVNNIERFNGKVEEHTKANNEKKVKAYGRKLQEAKNALEEFKISLRKSFDSSTLSDEKKKELEKDLGKAGCSI